MQFNLNKDVNISVNSMKLYLNEKIEILQNWPYIGKPLPSPKGFDAWSKSAVTRAVSATSSETIFVPLFLLKTCLSLGLCSDFSCRDNERWLCHIHCGIQHFSQPAGQSRFSQHMLTLSEHVAMPSSLELEWLLNKYSVINKMGFKIKSCTQRTQN